MRRRGRNVYESWLTVKMPLLFNRDLSLSGRLARRLRSSFSTAIFLQRLWNPHSGQCRFRIRSGGAAADNRAATLPTVLWTTRDNELGFTLKTDPLSPWMIFAMPTFTAEAFESTNASKPTISLSERDSLFAATKRIGTNCDDLFVPSGGIRSTI